MRAGKILRSFLELDHGRRSRPIQSALQTGRTRTRRTVYNVRLRPTVLARLALVDFHFLTCCTECVCRARIMSFVATIAATTAFQVGAPIGMAPRAVRVRDHARMPSTAKPSDACEHFRSLMLSVVL